MKISFITAVYNCLPFTKEMVESLRATLPDGLEYEVFIVDDGSTDGTREWLKTLQAPFRVLLNETNLGFAASNNRAARTAAGELLFLLNNDLVLLPGWLEPMLRAFERCRRPGVIGNLQLAHASGELDHRGVLFDPLRRPYHDKRRLTFGSYRAYSRYRAVTAACCAVRRDCFLEAGGFDEAYRNGYEDIDLCLRLERRGFRNYIANRSLVRHRVSSSPDRFVRETANLELFLSRWGWPKREPSQRRLGFAYLRRYWYRPWRYNGSKLLLALARIATNRSCDSLIKRWNIRGATT